MLELGSPRWRELMQAYGTAEDIPRLLEVLAESSEEERGELWFGLWSTLCHQGDVYRASYAALPHLVRLAGDWGAERAAEALHLAGAIEVGRVTPGSPPLPEELAGAYREAIEELPRVVAARVAEPWSADTTQVMSAVLAIAKGHVRFGNAALLLESSVECPVCGASHVPAGWDLEGEG
jgi:hypothetical protein